MNNTLITDEKQKILDFTTEKFFAEGFHKTTIAEIAIELQISKNTIYKYFPTKENLVKSVIEYTINRISTNISRQLSSNENAIVKLVKMLDFLTQNIMKFSDKWLRDLQLHAPHIWKIVDETRQKIMYKNLSLILEQGKKEKFFSDYPSDIILMIFTTSIRAIVNPAFLLHIKYTYRDAVNTTFEILLNGILTEKGKTVFRKIKLPL